MNKRLSENVSAPKATSSASEDPASEPLLMSRLNDDPFYSVRDEVRSQAEQIRARHDKFQDLVRNCDTSSNIEFKDLRKGLVKDVRSTVKMLKGLRDGVEMVEKNRLKFPHIKDSELATRKRFVDDMEILLNDVKAGMESQAVRRKMEDDENKSKRDAFDSSASALSVNTVAERTKDNDRFLRDQQQVTKQVIREQDVQLDQLGKSVDRLGEISKSVNQELNEQNKMLDRLETDLDDAGNKMNVVMDALSKLLKTKDGCQIWTIVILAVILILLVALVIWT